MLSVNKNEGALFTMTKQQWNERKSFSLYQNFKLIFMKFLQWFVDFLFSLLFIYVPFHISNMELVRTAEICLKQKKFLQYLWSDSQKTVPEISWEQCSHMRFPTNFTDQQNLNSLNLFPNSKRLRYVSYHKCLVMCRNCGVK